MKKIIVSFDDYDGGVESTDPVAKIGFDIKNVATVKSKEEDMDERQYRPRCSVFHSDTLDEKHVQVIPSGVHITTVVDENGLGVNETLMEQVMTQLDKRDDSRTLVIFLRSAIGGAEVGWWVESLTNYNVILVPVIGDGDDPYIDYHSFTKESKENYPLIPLRDYRMILDVQDLIGCKLISNNLTVLNSARMRYSPWDNTMTEYQRQLVVMRHRQLNWLSEASEHLREKYSTMLDKDGYEVWYIEGSHSESPETLLKLTKTNLTRLFVTRPTDNTQRENIFITLLERSSECESRVNPDGVEGKHE